MMRSSTRLPVSPTSRPAGLSIRELERVRDDNLVGIMEVLERAGESAGGSASGSGWGAGALLGDARRAMRERFQRLPGAGGAPGQGPMRDASLR